MAKRCPSCDSVVILSLPDAGNGKCSNCHGRGTTNTIVNDISGSNSKCWKCKGTGICLTCGGSGRLADGAKLPAARPYASDDVNPLIIRLRYVHSARNVEKSTGLNGSFSEN